MSAVLARSWLGWVAVALWLVPYVLPCGDPGGPGFWVALALGVVWPLGIIRILVREVPSLERRRRCSSLEIWLVVLGLGLLALLVDWALWPSLCLWCAPASGVSDVMKVHHGALVNGGLSAAFTAALIVLMRLLRRPIDVERVPYHRWVAGAALVLALNPSLEQLTLTVLATGVASVHELPLLERSWPGGVIGRFARLAGGGLFAWCCLEAWVSLADQGSRAGHVFASLFVAATGLVVITLASGTARALAWLLSGIFVLRHRMLAMGLGAIALGHGLKYVNIGIGDGSSRLATLLPSLLVAAVCASAVTAVLAATLSKPLTQSLRSSIAAMAEIARGNLQVTLGTTGTGEVAEVARGIDQMLVKLREAEFLERINEEQRARGAALARTLDALREAQANLVRSERMASVATLVKGIAHELNNPIHHVAGNLVPLRRYSDFLTRVATELSDGRARGPAELAALTRLSEGKDLDFVTRDLLRVTADIAEASRRAELIVTDLQSLTSAAQRVLERVDLGRVARQTVSLLSARVPPDVRLETEIGAVPLVTARAGQLEQVFINLVDNALHAVGERGTIRIEIASSKTEAIITISDDGLGMTPEVQRRALEPFFTTRAAGEGSGLGLSIVSSIVRAHRGRLELTSGVAVGTRVVLGWPLVPDASLDAELASDERLV
jgi:signal transduction histidine kinase